MLILASASPRRRDLLTQAGLEFHVEPADIDEEKFPDESAANYVSRIAEEKAQAVFARNPGSTVLGADTCVLIDGDILGKPRTLTEARAMLQGLSGRTHQVLTGVAVITPTATNVAVEITQVTFNPIPPHELDHYLRAEDPLDKAGAYGIQGYAARWIPRIDGCYFNVMGLPLARTIALLGLQGEAPR